MVQRGVSYYEIWKIVEKYFPLYVEIMLWKDMMIERFYLEQIHMNL